MKLRRVLVSVALGALVAAGCGGGGDGGDRASGGDVVVRTADEAFAALGASSDATTEAGSVRFAIEMEITGGPEAMVVAVDGAFDLDSGAGTFEMDLGALGVPGGGSVEARLVDGALYMDFSALAGSGGLGAGVRWVEMDLDALAGDLGVDLGDFGASNPSQLLDTLESLRGVSDDLELVGPEVVRDVPTEHYRVEVNLDAALGDVPESMRADLERSFAVLGLETLPMDVWIDSDDRVRRLDFELSSIELAEAGTDLAVHMSMELFDFGVEVNVVAPPPDETVDFLELFGAAIPQV
ncbi:MAG TPA: hypothetical protein VFZ83_00765 [Acidimicrobiia bacterium]|nr:hypothetical protein [Acidimicrobiia bacterium]